MDLYCIICGNCSWNKLTDSYDIFIDNCKTISENIKNNKNITDEKLLNNLDKYSNMNKYIDEKTYNILKKYTEYMDNITLLTQNNKIIKDANWISGVTYEDPNNEDEDEEIDNLYYVYQNYYETLSDDDPNFIGSKLIHTDCWRYIKHKYNKELKYSDLIKTTIRYENITELEKNKKMLFPPLNIDYGEIQNYWSNDYGYLIWNIIIDKKYYLLQSPLHLLKKLSGGTRIKKKNSKKNSKKKRNSKRNSKRNIKRNSKRNIKRNEINDDNILFKRIDLIYKQIIS
jgi:hypothetical protein